MTDPKKSPPSEATIRLGRRIRAIRTERELTQEQVAGLATLSAKFLGEVERGVSNISIDRLGKVAEVLGVELRDLMENEHERSRFELIQEITRMAPKLNERDAKIVYRLVKMMTRAD